MHDLLTVPTRDLKLAEKLRDSNSAKSLAVPVRATTAGFINGNRRFYRPDRMQEGTGTWLPQAPRSARPVLVGHKEDGDTVGRVVKAKYIDESYKYKVEFPQVRDSVFYSSDTKKKVDLFKSVDWIVENLVPRKDYAGLGYIELGLNITNPGAIEKVDRSEYLTVSVGFSTDSAICSICHTDWAIEDRCDHELGEKVDGKPTFLIVGGMDYDEVSFVNFPADPFASVLAKDCLQDNLKRLFFLGLPVGRQQQIADGLSLKYTDSLSADIRIEEPPMRRKKNAADSADNEVTTNAGDLSEEEINAAVLEASSGCGCDEEAPKLEDFDEADREFFADPDKIYDELVVEMTAAVAAGELTDSEAKDAKLSSEKRKSLKGSTFCGPNRSFPVPDCAHVTAARRLIGRAKVGESTKSKILSCVSKKAQSLGCGGKKDKAQGDSNPFQTDRLKKVFGKVLNLDAFKGKDTTGAELAKLIGDLDKAYDSFDNDKKYMARMAVSSMMDDWYADSGFEYYTSQLAADKDHIMVKKSDLAEKDAKVAAAAGKDSEVATLRKTLATTLIKYKESLASKIVIFRTLTGHADYKNLDADQRFEKIQELSKRQKDSLEDTVSDIVSELKWNDKPATEANREKPAEAAPSTTVNDSTHVAEPVPAGVKDAQDDDSRKKDELERRKLAAMSPKERSRYQFEQRYKAAAKGK